MKNDDAEIRALHARVGALEASYARWRRAALAGALVILLALSTGMTANRTVEAEAVHLYDGEGKLRVLLSAKAGVSLLDAGGRARAVLSVDADGPGLALYGESSRAGVLANVNAAGPAIALHRGGQTQILLAAIEEGPGLLLSDEGGRERAAAVVRPSGAELTLLGKDGNALWKAP